MASIPITSWQIGGETVADFIPTGANGKEQVNAGDIRELCVEKIP